MRSITATEASRNFSALLDSVERGETVTVTRGGRTVAELVPPTRRTGRDLRNALESIAPPDDSFADDIRAAVGLLVDEPADPWLGR
jgi:prevent-host-death family protein